MSFIDWLIVALFLVALVTIGFLFSRKNKNIEDYFVAGRSMPGWLVAIAATGTTISAGTFVGSPELGFNTNLTYLINLIGSIFGGCLVAALILPKLYNAKTITIYGYIGDRFGESSKTANSIMFLLGQLFTSGSRLFIAAIAISVIVFGSIQFQFLIWSIIILGVVSTIYTMLGGIKGLLYIDTFQTILMIFTALVALGLLIADINDIPFSEVWHTLTDGGTVKTPAGWTSGSKIQMFDPSIRFDVPYTILGGMVGIAFFKICQYTTDQEFVQRQLACHDVKKAGWSLVSAQLLVLPVVMIFLSIGLLLYVKYTHDAEGAMISGTSFFKDARDIFPQYIKNNIPAGIRGLMITGLLAAALSSFNSAINSMASSFVADIYFPLKKKSGKSEGSDKDQIAASKKMVILMGMCLTAFAIVTCVMQQQSGLNLVDFTTGVMCFAYAGMIGVFLTAIFTKRGNNRSVIAALLAGVAIILPLMFQKQLFGQTYIAWSWWCLIGGTVSFLICVSGKKKV
ncbi:MAG: sodium/solute symporter [Bacteroidales bacterium]|nr:sodium/solute symporter [Bacteroidales bacterium]